jgi:hypothetical protein
MKKLFVLALSVGLFSATSNSPAAPTCEITPEKKELIGSLLCGQAAIEREYQERGPGCFERSITKRLQDSAIQIHVFRLCGEPEFAAQLEAATVKAIRFMEALAPCLNESVDIESVMQGRTAFVKNKAAGMGCSADIRSTLEQRRAAFEAMVAQSKDPNLSAAIFDRLSISIDAEGNVRDR